MDPATVDQMSPKPSAEATGWGVHLIVDGMNVIGAHPDGWWRDRPGAQARLVRHLAPLADDGTDVTVVFDGRGSDEARAEAPQGVDLLFAPGGPGAADDAIVELVRRLPRPPDAVVVTSDRALGERVRRLGAQVEGAKAFRARLGDPRDGPNRRGAGSGGGRGR